MEENLGFGENLRRIRTQKRMDRNELAELTQKSVSMIYGYEKELVVPSYESVSKMAKALGVNIADLLELEVPIFDEDKAYKAYLEYFNLSKEK